MRVNLYPRNYRGQRGGKKANARIIWWGQWTDDRIPKGEKGHVVRRSTKCTDRRAAGIVAARWERDFADPLHHAAHTTTIGDAAKRFLTECAQRGLAPETVGMYRIKLGHFVRLEGASRLMAHVDARCLDHFVDERRAEGAKDHTIHKELVSVRGMLTTARRRGEFQSDPRAVMPIKFATGYVPRERVLSWSELRMLAHGLPAGRAAAMWFVVATSARRREVFAARRVGDIGAASVHLRGTKTAKSDRQVPIVPMFRELLDAAVAYADGEGGRMFRPWVNANRDLQLACQAAGFPRVSWNDLRRTFASLLVQAGADEAHVARALGNANTTMVRKVYGRHSQESLGALLSEATASTCDSRASTQHPPVETGEVEDMTNEATKNGAGVNVVPRDGIEPPTRGFSSPASGGGFVDGGASLPPDVEEACKITAGERREVAAEAHALCNDGEFVTFERFGKKIADFTIATYGRRMRFVASEGYRAGLAYAGAAAKRADDLDAALADARGTLARSQDASARFERAANDYLTNLTSTQKRCTAQLDDIRRLAETRDLLLKERDAAMTSLVASRADAADFRRERDELKAIVEKQAAHAVPVDYRRSGDACEQIEKLARFICDEIEGEPSRDERAVDTAIRLLRKRGDAWREGREVGIAFARSDAPSPSPWAPKERIYSSIAEATDAARADAERARIGEWVYTQETPKHVTPAMRAMAASMLAELRPAEQAILRKRFGLDEPSGKEVEEKEDVSSADLLNLTAEARKVLDGRGMGGDRGLGEGDEMILRNVVDAVERSEERNTHMLGSLVKLRGASVRLVAQLDQEEDATDERRAFHAAMKSANNQIRRGMK